MKPCINDIDGSNFNKNCYWTNIFESNLTIIFYTDGVKKLIFFFFICKLFFIINF